MIFGIISRLFKLKNAVEIYSKFKLLQSDEARFSYLRNAIKLDNVFDRCSPSDYKCPEKTLDFIRDGEVCENTGDLEEARILYTKAISWGPFLSVQENQAVQAQTALAKAFAHRSILLYKSGRFSLCFRDIAYACEIRSRALGHEPRKIEIQHAPGGTICFEMKETLRSLLLNDNNMDDVNERRDLEIDLVTCGLHVILEDKRDNVPPPPEVSYRRNSSIPNCSDCVELKSAGHMGRGLFATRDIEPGDVIIVEDPFSWKLADDYVYLFCSHCMKFCVGLIPCSHCSQVMYCSDECREAAWNMYHDVECQLLPLISSTGNNDGLRLLLLLRTVIIARKMFKSLTEFYETVKAFDKLQEHEKHSANYKYYQVYKNARVQKHNMEDSELEHVAYFIAVFFGHLLETKTDFFSEITSESHGNVSSEDIKIFIHCLLLRHLRNHIRGIFHKVEDEPKDPGLVIGNGIYSIRSLINHSCDPNVFDYIWPGNKLVVRGQKKLIKGEQVFISYGPLYYEQPLHERQNILLKNYRFNCSCNACFGNFSHDFPIECNSCGTILLKELEDLFTKYISCDNCDAIMDFDDNFHEKLCNIIRELNEDKVSMFSPHADLPNILKKLKANQSIFGRGCLVFPYERALRAYYERETIYSSWWGREK